MAEMMKKMIDDTLKNSMVKKSRTEYFIAQNDADTIFEFLHFKKTTENKELIKYVWDNKQYIAKTGRGNPHAIEILFNIRKQKVSYRWSRLDDPSVQLELGGMNSLLKTAIEKKKEELKWK